MPFKTPDRKTPRGRPLLLLAAAIMLLPVMGRKANAGAPEYMQLNAQPGMALEIEGVWDTKAGIFVADDIEVLPLERLPKLRGAIQEIDREDSVITMYGMAVKVYERTEFIEDGAGGANFSALKEGMRIEVSCKFEEDGSWKARKIKSSDVKASDKIKGTLTRAVIDGTPPDTLDISGLLILLVDETDIIARSGSLREIEDELFPDLRMADLEYPSGGVPLGHALLLNADYRQAVVVEDQYDLTDYFSSDHNETEPAVRLELTAFPDDRVQAFAQVRVRKKYSIGGDGASQPAGRLDAHFSQLYVLARNFGIRGLALQVGRQDFEDDREWLYDDYLDAARAYYYGIKPLVLEAAYIHAVEPMKAAFKTWTDVMVQMHAYPNIENHISSYFIMRSDTDARNREPRWYGIRYDGKLRNIISPWLEYSIMSGHDKGRELEAHAFDFGATVVAARTRYRPSATLGYAVGTGDKVNGDDIDNRFRQTGYEDNVDYLGGVAPVHYYSEVIDPELSNLKVLTVAIGARPILRGSVDMVYHAFRQHRPKNELTGSDLVDPPARPNGISDDLGREIDVILGLDKLWGRLSLSWTLGFFDPGEAFDPYLENAILNRFNLKLEL